MVNIIGDHATYHRRYDAPLNSDIAAIAAPNSIWLKSAESPDEVGPLAAEAVAASYGPPGGSASLLLPADCAWSQTTVVGPRTARPAGAAVASEIVDEMARAIRSAKKPVLLLGSPACGEAGLRTAGRSPPWACASSPIHLSPVRGRGAGRFAPDRMMYFGEMALADLEGVDLMVLVETVAPVAFFAYPERPSVLVPEGCADRPLARRGEDGAAAMESLADALGAPESR